MVLDMVFIFLYMVLLYFWSFILFNIAEMAQVQVHGTVME